MRIHALFVLPLLLSSIASGSTTYVKYRAVEAWEPDAGVWGYNNAAGEMEWALGADRRAVRIMSELSYPNLTDFFDVTVPVVVTSDAILVNETSLPGFLHTALWINPGARAINMAGKYYYLDTSKVPYGWDKFLRKREYVDSLVIYSSHRGERVIDGKRYLELGGQRSYYSSSSGLLILIVYDYTLIEASGKRIRAAGKLFAVESNADQFPWKEQMRLLAASAILSFAALGMLVRILRRRVRGALTSPNTRAPTS